MNPLEEQEKAPAALDQAAAGNHACKSIGPGPFGAPASDAWRGSRCCRATR